MTILNAWLRKVVLRICRRWKRSFCKRPQRRIRSRPLIRSHIRNWQRPFQPTDSPRGPRGSGFNAKSTCALPFTRVSFGKPALPLGKYGHRLSGRGSLQKSPMGFHPCSAGYLGTVICLRSYFGLLAGCGCFRFCCILAFSYRVRWRPIRLWCSRRQNGWRLSRGPVGLWTGKWKDAMRWRLWSTVRVISVTEHANSRFTGSWTAQVLRRIMRLLMPASTHSTSSCHSTLWAKKTHGHRLRIAADGGGLATPCACLFKWRVGSLRLSVLRWSQV